MRHRLPLILAMILPAACASMWVRSWHRFDEVIWEYGCDLSEGGVVVHESHPRGRFESRSGPAMQDGRYLDGSVGSHDHPWLPVQRFASSSSPERLLAVRWWFITALSCLPALWVWRRRRRRRDGTRGFEVGRAAA